MPWQCWQHKHPPNQNHPHPQLIRRGHRKLLSKCTNASQFLISSNALVSAVHNYISSICISSLDWPRQDGWRMLRCEKVEAEMEIRWRQDVFAILDSSPPQHAMIQCGRNTLWTPMQGDDAIMKCARQQCDVWGRTHFKKWVQMYIFKSKATACCSSVLFEEAEDPLLCCHTIHTISATRSTLSVMSLTRMKTMVIWWQWLNNLGWRNSSHVQCTLYRLILLPPFDSHLINLESDQ